MNIGMGIRIGNTASAPVWKPTQLSSLVAYYDASVATPTSTAWADQSGAGNNLSGHCVVNSTGGPNNGPYAGSDGTTTVLSAAFTLTQPWEIFLLASVNWVPNGANQCLFDGYSLNGGKSNYNQLATNQLNMYAGANNQVYVGTPPSPASAWRVYDYQFNGASSTFTVSGTAATVIGSPGTNAPNGITLFMEGGGYTNDRMASGGGIAAVMICSAIQSASQRTNALAFLAAKGGT